MEMILFDVILRKGIGKEDKMVLEDMGLKLCECLSICLRSIVKILQLTPLLPSLTHYSPCFYYSWAILCPTPSISPSQHPSKSIPSSPSAVSFLNHYPHLFGLQPRSSRGGANWDGTSWCISAHNFFIFMVGFEAYTIHPIGYRLSWGAAVCSFSFPIHYFFFLNSYLPLFMGLIPNHHPMKITRDLQKD